MVIFLTFEVLWNWVIQIERQTNDTNKWQIKRRTDKKAEQIETKNKDYHTDKIIVRQKDRETTEQSQKRQTSSSNWD